MRALLFFWLISVSAVCGIVGYRAARNRTELARLSVRSEQVAQAAVIQREEAEQKLADLDQQLNLARRKLSAAEALLGVRTAEHPAATPSKSAALQKQLEQDPAYAPFRRRDMRRNIIQLYGEILNKSTLPPEKLEQLKQLLEERNYASKDVMEITGTSETQRMTKLGVQAMMQAQVSVDAEIRELAGETMYHDLKYASFYRMLDTNVAEFEDSLATRRLLPLNPAQRDAVKAAYRCSTYPCVPGEEKNPVLGGRHGPEVDKEIEQRVQGVLSSEQFAALTEYHRDSRALIGMYSRADDEMIKGLRQ